jgi:hypothetical protein
MQLNKKTKAYRPGEIQEPPLTKTMYKHNQRMSDHHQSIINRTTATTAVIFPDTANFGRLIFQIFMDVKEIFTTGFEMANVVSGGDANSLLEKQAAASHLKNKWVFS